MIKLGILDKSAEDVLYCWTKDFIDKVSREALFITLTCIVGDKGTCEMEGFLQKNLHVIVYCP